MSILFIEDEISKNKAHAAALSLAKYQVDWVTTAKEAVERIVAKKKYDLILLDIMMPVPTHIPELGDEKTLDKGYATGIELLKLINKNLPDTKVIIVSARYDLKNFLVDSTYFSYITKPAKPQEIIEEMRKVTEKAIN